MTSLNKITELVNCVRNDIILTKSEVLHKSKAARLSGVLKLIDHLNEVQRNAVIHNKGPMMVLAGPGSGKTTVIIHRVKYLIEEYNVSPRQILVVTFTKAAASEMKKRFLELTGAGRTNVTLSTFHSLFYRIIKGNYDLDSVVREDERKMVIKNIFVKLGVSIDEETVTNVMNEMGYITNNLIPVQEFSSAEISDENFSKVCAAYEEYKTARNKIDFDDMMIKCHELFLSNPDILKLWQDKFEYILVDEFQDISKIQYECLKMLADKEKNLFIVGDDDQSIYSFRGSRPEFLLNFSEEYPQTQRVILNINYRSNESIIKLCNRIISRNKARHVKEMKGTGRVGEPPKIIYCDDTESEAKIITDKIRELSREIPLTEMAVIYRVNLQSRAFIDIFINENLPFTIKDQTPSIYEHWVVKDIIAYLRLSQNRNLPEEGARIINKPSRYINNSFVREALQNGKFFDYLLTSPYLKPYQKGRIDELLFYLNAISKRTPYDAYKYIRNSVGYSDYILSYCEYRKIKHNGLFEILDELQEGSKNFETINEYIEHVEKARESGKKKEIGERKTEGITLSTMHSAKGLEYEAVFVISAVEGIIPYEKSSEPSEIEEERRLFYVGATRAKNYLYISVVRNKNGQEMQPTPFLSEIVQLKGVRRKK